MATTSTSPARMAVVVDGPLSKNRSGTNASRVSRAFPDWAMGFVGVSESDENLVSGIGLADDLVIERAGADEIPRVMLELARVEEQLSSSGPR